MISDVVLVVDKPPGMTSFDVVRRVRRAAGVRRVGHGGTLDPLASGVLPVCLGEATKLAQFFLGADKEYEVTLELGVETDTDDADGTPTVRGDASAVDPTSLAAALPRFRGQICQVPPAYAAIKRDGRALYTYARAGQAIEVEARPVTVYALELVAFESPASVKLVVRCSKGTYVRALVRDLGRDLRVGAHVTALRRTRSGSFALADARPLAEVLDRLVDPGNGPLPALPLAAALPDYPRLVVGRDVARDLRDGKRVPWSTLSGAAVVEPCPQLVCVLDSSGGLVAVAQPRPDGTTKTLRVFGNAPNLPSTPPRRIDAAEIM